MADHLDGNSLAGALAEFSCFEPTEALGMCGECADDGPIARFLVYGSRIGRVARCPNCGNILMVHVRTPDGIYLNTSGLRWLRISDP